MKNAGRHALTGPVPRVQGGVDLTESPQEPLLALTLVTLTLPLLGSTAGLGGAALALLPGRQTAGDSRVAVTLRPSPASLALALGPALRSADVLPPLAGNLSRGAGAVLAHPAGVAEAGPALALSVAGALLAVARLRLTLRPLIFPPATVLLALAPEQRYSQAWLSLVQLLHYCALIGRELHSDEILLW